MCNVCGQKWEIANLKARDLKSHRARKSQISCAKTQQFDVRELVAAMEVASESRTPTAVLLPIA